MIRRGIGNSPQMSPGVSSTPIHQTLQPSTPTIRAGSISRVQAVARSGSITRISPSTPSRYTSQLSPVSIRRPFTAETPHRSFFLPFPSEPHSEAPPRPASSRSRLPLRENFALLKAEVLSAKRRRPIGSDLGDELRRLVDRGRAEIAQISCRSAVVFA